MKYRKLRKKYTKRFGNTTFLALKDKNGKTSRKWSKVATAWWMKKCLELCCDGFELLGRALEEKYSGSK